MTTVSPSIPKTFASLVAAALLVAGASAEEVSVTLSNGTNIKMTEPRDMMGLTWANTKGALPSVFLLVDEGAAGPQEALGQLLATARSIGHMYVNRYERASGGAEDGADLMKIEETLARLRGGGGSAEDRAAVAQGEAVVFWSAMLEDTAAKIGVKQPNNSSPNASPAFLDAYSDAIKAGGGSGIYEEAIRAIARDNPVAIDRYIAKAAPERRAVIEALLSGAVPRS